MESINNHRTLEVIKTTNMKIQITKFIYADKSVARTMTITTDFQQITIPIGRRTYNVLQTITEIESQTIDNTKKYVP